MDHEMLSQEKRSVLDSFYKGHLGGAFNKTAKRADADYERMATMDLGTAMANLSQRKPGG